MFRSYPLQRKMINSDSNIAFILFNWPFFQEESVFLLHAKVLIGMDVRQQIGDSYLTKAPRLNRFFKSHAADHKEDLTKVLEEAVEQQASQTNVQALLPAVILCIMKSFGEKESGMFFLCDENSTKTDIERCNKECWPRLAMLGNTVLVATTYMLVVDGQVIISGMTSFLTALSALFLSYYIFNIEYPKEAAATLEFIQRCLVGINPDKGSKAGKKKRNSSMNPKVLKLINAIADFEWSSLADPSTS